jgi:hypothetical protein
MLLAVCRSVVTLGAVHVSSTRSPLRAPRRSAGGFGSSSDGGCGGPIVAHAVNITGAAKTKSVEAERLMRRNQTTRPPYAANSRTASRNTFVCRSTSSASVCGDINAML